jgi:hypothetical protein
METQRYMNEENLETWVCILNDYKELNGIVVPTTTEAIWQREKGDFSYARFNLKKFEYDKPEKF